MESRVKSRVRGGREEEGKREERRVKSRVRGGGKRRGRKERERRVE